MIQNQARYELIQNAEDFEFFQILGSPDYMSNEMERVLQWFESIVISNTGLYSSEELETILDLSKSMKQCLDSEICYQAFDKYEDKMTRKGWDMLRKAINGFLALPTIQADIAEMQKDPKWNREARRQRIIDAEKKRRIEQKEMILEQGGSLEIPTELVYWEK